MLDRLIQEDTFFVKGQYHVNLRKFIEEHLKAGSFDEILETAGYDGKIFPATRIPLDKSNEIVDQTARVLGKTRKEAMIDFTRFLLEVDLNGLLRLILRMGGTQNVLKRSAQITTTYTNYFLVKVEDNQPGRCLISITFLKHYKDYVMPSIEGALIGLCNVCKTPLKRFTTQTEEPFRHEGHKMVKVLTVTEY